MQRENIGYELLAVKAIFRTYWPDLQRCIAVANKVRRLTTWQQQRALFFFVPPCDETHLCAWEERFRDICLCLLLCLPRAWLFCLTVHWHGWFVVNNNVWVQKEPEGARTEHSGGIKETNTPSPGAWA